MSFFLKAGALGLRDYPDINAVIDGDEVVRRDHIHISVAVSTEKGLITPVVKFVDLKSFADIETEIIGFARRAAAKTLLPDELTGGTFTITNGGVFGSLLSTPLPSPNQSAILGMHAIKERPIAVEGRVEIRPMMNVALTYDHRLVDGREAVGFLKTVKNAVEDPERLLLDI
jgi:2-oxoglutarate dehydrogenase E2 component (dihydrolipoamide succinyltransferase)